MKSWVIAWALLSVFAFGSERAAGAVEAWWKGPEAGTIFDRRDINPTANTAVRTKWDEGYIEVRAGATTDMRRAANRAQARSMAARAARHLAYEKLAESVESLSLDGERTLKKEILQDSSLRVRVQARIHRARIVRETVEDLPDGSVWADVVVGLLLNGPGGVSATLSGWTPPRPTAGEYRPNPAYTTEGQYTGLVVDASGLDFAPALAPRLLVAEDRSQVFGPSDIERQAVESRGMVGYSDSLLAARSDARVGGKPLIVRATGVSGDRRGDLLVSRRDAERIRALDRQSRALKQAAVIVVVGKGTAELLQEGKGRRYALVVGVGDYEQIPGKPRVAPLRFAAEDARDLARLLVEQGGYAPEHVRLLINEQAGREAVYSALKVLRDTVREEDVVVIFFSGHGTVGTGKDRASHFYLVPYDARLDDLPQTAVRDDVFEELVAQLPSRQVVILLDACYSGGVAGKRVKGFSNPALTTMPSGKVFIEAGEGRVTLSASRPDQPSIEDDNLKHGVFTHFLLEGFAGKADRDQDGRVTVLEVYQYLSSAVRNYTYQTHGFEQVPVLDVRGMTGEIVVRSGVGRSGG